MLFAFFPLPRPSLTEISAAPIRVGLKQGKILVLSFSFFNSVHPHTSVRTSRTSQVSFNVASGAGTTRSIG